MRTPGVLSEEQAETQAAQAREEGRSIVRDHLSNHIVQNVGRSSDYVSWIATLHPENADVTIDQRFFIPGNPWWTIYEQAKGETIPTATAVPVIAQEDSNNINDDDDSSSTALNNSIAAGETCQNHDAEMPSFLLRCSPIDVLVSFLLTLQTVLIVLAFELVAIICYMIAVLFYRLGKCFDPPNVLTGILFSVCMMLYYSLALCDSILLLTSVLVTELTALVGWFVSVLFGGIWMANQRHQYTRCMCHGFRSVFRSHFTKPPRHFVWCGTGEKGRGSFSVGASVHNVEQPDVVIVGGDSEKEEESSR